MDISLNGLWTKSYQFVRGKIAEGLSPLEKKVVLLAALYFAIATIGYFLYEWYNSRKSVNGNKLNSLSQTKNQGDNRSVAGRVLENEETEDVGRNVEGTSGAIVVKNVDQIRSMLKDSLGNTHNPGEQRKLFLDKEGRVQQMSGATAGSLISLDGQSEVDPSLSAVKIMIHTDCDPTTTKPFEWVGTTYPLIPNPLQDIIDSTIHELNQLAKGAFRLATKNDPQNQAAGGCDWMSYLENVNDYPSLMLHNAELTVQERLEKNRRFAEAQQKEEKKNPNGFKSVPGNLPAVLTPYNNSLESESKKINGIADVGIAWCQGLRPEMEDAHLADQGSFKLKTAVDFTLFGLFDGHGGDGAAIFARDNLKRCLIEAMETHCQEGLTEEGIYRAIKDCFVKLDAENTKEYDNHVAPTKGAADPGTTATVALILDGRLWVANVGDSRTILVNNDGTAIQASEDANPDIPRYKLKIENLGGYVESSRVNGSLGVARAIGDKHLKGSDSTCLISPKPKITCYPLDFDYCVLACDGLYDVATTDEVGTALVSMQNESAEMRAKRLVRGAIDNYSKDNVSVIVIKR